MKIATNTILLSLVALPALALLVSPVSAGCKIGTKHVDAYTTSWDCWHQCGEESNCQAWNDFKCCDYGDSNENELNIDKVLDYMNEELDNIDKKLNNNR